MEQRNQAISALRKSGKSIADISKELNIGKTTVSSVIKKEKAVVPDDGPSLHLSEEVASTFIDSIKTEAPVPADEAAFIKAFSKKILRPKPVRKEANEIVREALKEAPVAIQEVAKVLPLDKATIIAQITSLANAYAPLLTDHIKNTEEFVQGLSKKSINELILLQDMLNNTKTIANGANAMRHIFLMAASAVEFGSSTFLKMKSQGFAASLDKHNDELRMIFTEIAAANMVSIRKVQRPEARLAFLMVQTLMMTDAQNRAKETVDNKPAVDKPEYNDL